MQTMCICLKVFSACEFQQFKRCTSLGNTAQSVESKSWAFVLGSATHHHGYTKSLSHSPVHFIAKQSFIIDNFARAGVTLII